MMDLPKEKVNDSEDEDESLEMLRLAALSTLKSKSNKNSNVVINNNLNTSTNNCTSNLQSTNLSTFGAPQTTRNKRGFRNKTGRNGRNGLISRIRTNPNLISIPTIDETESLELKNMLTDVPKLILPQDRYHKTKSEENTTEECSVNKFNRYDKHDSESDSENEHEDTLEFLLNDLQNKINENDSDISLSDTELTINNELSEANEMAAPSPELVQTNKSVSPVSEEKSLTPTKEKSPSPMHRKSQSPSVRGKSRSPSMHRKSRSPLHGKSRSRSRSPTPNVKYRSPRRVDYSSPLYQRPLSPLLYTTEVLSTITKAPLSPRSAAFVLENRQILARRQMSLSRSRSKTPPRRRARTPRRSFSPKKKSTSPRNSFKRRSTSPRNNYRRRSPYQVSKRKRSKSPVSKQVTNNRLDKRKLSPSVKRRRTSKSISLSLSPSPERTYKRPLKETISYLNRRDKPRNVDEPPKKEEKSLDPVLEARKRKFEKPIQIENNGIIKLKLTKSEDNLQQPKQPENSGEAEDHDEVLDLNPTVNDLWSDEESDTECEGRFKSKSTTETKNITILPFRKLTEKPKSKETNTTANIDKDSRSERRNDRSKRRTRTPEPRKSKTIDSENKRTDKNYKSTNTTIKTYSASIDTGKRKEKTDKLNKVSETSTKTNHSEKQNERKIKIHKSGRKSPHTPDITKESGNINHTPVLQKNNSDDLRAEISRRRAEKLHKNLPTRILQTALHAVTKKRPAEKETKASGKLPIHMRLGSTKKEGNVKERSRIERSTNKRSRTQRRKKQV